MKDKPNKVTTVLKVVVTGEFYDDDATGETLRYAVEQDLEDAGFDVDVTPLKDKETKTGKWLEEIDYYLGDTYYKCSVCGELWTTIDGTPKDNGMKYCPHCGARMDA